MATKNTYSSEVKAIAKSKGVDLGVAQAMYNSGTRANTSSTTSTTTSTTSSVPKAAPTVTNPINSKSGSTSGSSSRVNSGGSMNSSYVQDALAENRVEQTVGNKTTSTQTVGNKTTSTPNYQTSTYNGTKYTVDLNTDYQSLINNSTSAAAKEQYENLRNAKIAYMLNNGLSTNETYTNNYQTNKDYNGVSYNNYTDYTTEINNALAKGDYALASSLTDSRNAKIAANQAAGTLADGITTSTNNYNYNNVNELPSGWSTGVINGNTVYNNNGRYYSSSDLSSSSFLGDGYNPIYDSYTYSNQNDALQAALKYLSNTAGLSEFGLDANDYYLENGSIDGGFVDAIAGGYADRYSQYLAEQKKAKQQQLLAQQQQQEEYQNLVDEYYALIESLTEQNNTINQNIENTNSQTNFLNAYQNYVKQQMRNRFTHLL